MEVYIHDDVVTIYILFFFFLSLALPTQSNPFTERPFYFHLFPLYFVPVTHIFTTKVNTNMIPLDPPRPASLFDMLQWRVCGLERKKSEFPKLIYMVMFKLAGLWDVHASAAV